MNAGEGLRALLPPSGTARFTSYPETMTTSQRSEDIRMITWRLDSFHTASYFTSQVDGALRDLGLAHASDRYLASRSAPLGAVTGEAAAAIFYAFSRAYVSRSLPKAWEIASPEQVHAARISGVRDMVRDARARAEGLRNAGTVAQIDEQAAGLNAALAPVIAAMDDTYRPLSAATRRALTGVPAAAEEPVFALWITATHLREYRGDCHGAVLATAGVAGADASVYTAWTEGHSLPRSPGRSTAGPHRFGQIRLRGCAASASSPATMTTRHNLRMPDTGCATNSRRPRMRRSRPRGLSWTTTRCTPWPNPPDWPPPWARQHGSRAARRDSECDDRAS